MAKKKVVRRKAIRKKATRKKATRKPRSLTTEKVEATVEVRLNRTIDSRAIRFTANSDGSVSVSAGCVHKSRLFDSVAQIDEFATALKAAVTRAKAVRAAAEAGAS